MRFVTIHPSEAQHDAQCPVNLTGAGPKTHFRVTRPERYAPPHGGLTCPGHDDPSGRQGYYTDACCATNAARIIARRLVADVNVEPGTERLDVQVWR